MDGEVIVMHVSKVK